MTFKRKYIFFTKIFLEFGNIIWLKTTKYTFKTFVIGFPVTIWHKYLIMLENAFYCSTERKTKKTFVCAQNSFKIKRGKETHKDKHVHLEIIHGHYFLFTKLNK